MSCEILCDLPSCPSRLRGLLIYNTVPTLDRIAISWFYYWTEYHLVSIKLFPIRKLLLLIDWLFHVPAS